MDAKKDLNITLVHELWCCKREFHSFVNHSTLLFTNQGNKETRILAFTSYGNFIRHLYSYYEGIIEFKNAHLFEHCKSKEKGKKFDEILNAEIKKLIRNKVAAYQYKKQNLREIEHLTKSEVPENFGKDFRHIRNRFSHINLKRVNKQDISLMEFFKLYHKYVLLLLESSSFSWTVNDTENYDWAEIDNFLNYPLKNMQYK